MNSSEAENILLLSTVLAIELTKDKTAEEAAFLSNLLQAIGFQIAALAALQANTEILPVSSYETQEDYATEKTNKKK